MRNLLCSFILFFSLSINYSECNAVEITGKVRVENPTVISVVDFKGNAYPTHVNHLDSTYLLNINVDQPEIMTFFLTYKDDKDEKRQIYSPILVKESDFPVKINIWEENGFPKMTSDEINQKVFLDFTDFLVETFRNNDMTDEEKIPDKITSKINELKSLTNETHVSDYLELWGLSSRLSTERLLHMRSNLDPETKKKRMPRHDIAARDLIGNKATKYFPEFVSIVSREYGKWSTLTDKISSLEDNMPSGELLEYIETNMISEYINSNKTKLSPDVLIAQIDIVGKNKAEYDNWINIINGYKSYLKRGDEAPEDRLIAVDGTEFTLSDFKGKYLFIDFWASWCTYCIKEFPALEDIKKEFSDSDIQFIGISLDDNIENWKKALQKYNLNDTQFVVSSPELADKLGLSSIPRYIIYDKEGKMLYPETPRPRQTEKLIELLKSLS